MADELNQAITRLCVTAGMLMEDIIPDALCSLTSDLAERRTRLADLRQTSADVAALLAAAEVLQRRLQVSS